MKEKIDLKKHRHNEKNIIEDMDFDKAALNSDDLIKKKDDKKAVITVLMTAFLLLVTAVGLFVYAFTKDDHKNTGNKTAIYEDCDSIDDSELSEEQIEIKNTVVDFLDTMRNMNFDEAYKYTDDDESSFDFVANLLKKEDTSIVQYSVLLEKMMDYDYTINSVENNGDEATVNLVIKTYNFTTTVIDARLSISDAQAAYSLKNGSGSVNDKKKKEIAREEINEILSPMERKLRIPVKVKLVKDKGSWKITRESIDNGLYDAVCKNMLDSVDAYIDFYKKLNEGKINEVSIDSFMKYLEKRGIHYDENSQTSPFDD